MHASNAEACGERPCFHKDCGATLDLSLAFLDTEGEIENPFGLLEFVSQLNQPFHVISMLAQETLNCSLSRSLLTWTSTFKPAKDLCDSDAMSASESRP